MLINLRNALMAGKRLPYDAEVEFLESTGGQYINTGVLASAALNDAQIDITYSSSSTSGDLYIFGGGATFNTAIQCVINSSSNYFQPSWGQSLAIANGYAANAVATLRMTYNDYALTFGTTTRTGAFTATSRTFDDRAIYLFRGNRTSGGINTKPVRIYAFKISRNGIPILDLIPVRKGAVGYLYDRVSGKLFGNAGTGDFVLGPDVVPVEYIESHGTEYIDTGLVGRDGYDFEYRFRPMNPLPCGIGGEYQDNKNCYIGLVRTNGYLAYHFYDSQADILQVQQLALGADYNIKAHLYSGEQYFEVNGVRGGAGSRTGTFTSSYNLYLFAINSANQPAIFGVMRLYNLTARLNTIPIRSFRPVRVGTEGAMMDVLTRRIYRNQGTGAFTCGNDLKYPIPAE